MSRTGMERWRMGCTGPGYDEVGATAIPAPNSTQVDMESGWVRCAGAPAAARHCGREPPKAGGWAVQPRGSVHTHAPCVKTGATPSALVKNPEAYTGSRLLPAMTTSFTCHCTRAWRTV